MQGKIINRNYLVEEKIGEGGMGVVHKGRQLSLQRHVAIKFLTGNILNNKILTSRFRREALASIQISHPNIIKIIDLDVVDTTHYLVMEYIAGGSLEDLLDKRERFSEKEGCQLILQAISGLKVAHHRSIVHRDLKPANILLTRDHQIKITDFGIAHFEEMTQLTQTGSVLGTPQYMSPEQALGKAIDERSDIYSLGVIFYQMLTGEPPFQANNAALYLQKHAYATPKSPRDTNPKISNYINDMILKMLAKAPIDRFKSMDSLENTLLTYLRTRR